MEEDGLTYIVRRPGERRSIRIVNVATPVSLATIPRWIEKVDCCAPCDAVPRRTDIAGNIMLADDIGRAKHFLPGIEVESRVMVARRVIRIANQRKIVWLGAAGQKRGKHLLPIYDLLRHSKAQNSSK